MREINILYIICLVLCLVFDTKEVSSATDNYGVKVFNKTSSHNSKLYVSLGDSFASGLGAKDYILSSGSCFRSKNAFSINEEYGIAIIYNFIPKFYACSGATTKTLLKSQINKHKALLKKLNL